jgi:hypothetical protein
MQSRPWLKPVIIIAVIAIIIGIGVRAAIAAVQNPFLVQAEEPDGNGMRYALVVVQRTPSNADIEQVIKDFASQYPHRPITAEFYTDGNAAVAFEGGGSPNGTSTDTAAAHVGEFTRGPSGPGQGWADAKGGNDSGKVTFQAS